MVAEAQRHENSLSDCQRMGRPPLSGRVREGRTSLCGSQDEAAEQLTLDEHHGAAVFVTCGCLPSEPEWLPSS